MLKKALELHGLKESVSDPCVFLRGDFIVLYYVDDCILLSPKKGVIDEFIKSLETGPEKFVSWMRVIFSDTLELRLVNYRMDLVLNLLNHI